MTTFDNKRRYDDDDDDDDDDELRSAPAAICFKQQTEKVDRFLPREQL